MQKIPTPFISRQRPDFSRAASPEWPELIHPFASAIDTPLPRAPEHTHLLLDSKASWVEVDVQPNDQQFEGYPEESIEDWHLRLGLKR